MRILDRYVVRSMIVIFLLTVVVFGILYVLIDSAVNLDEFIDRQVTLKVLTQYYLLNLPIILNQTAGIACLIAILFTYSSLNSHNEIIVLRASGMTFWQITKPALIFALLVSTLILFVNEKYIPDAENKIKKIRNDNLILEVDRKKKKQAVIKNLTFYGMKNRLYFIDSFDPNTYDLEGITIVGYDSHQNIKEKIVALKGKWTGIAWKFYQCQVTTFSGNITAGTSIKVYEEKLVDIKETPEDFLKQRLEVKSMNIKQLADYISRFSDSGAKRALNNLRIDLYSKLTFPLGNFIIVFLGLPFAIFSHRRKAQTFTSLGIAVGIAFLYYVCDSVGLALGKGGLFHPLLSVALAPVIFAGAAVALIKSKF